MNMVGSEHQTVLLSEAVDALNIVPDGVYVDATFGRGGHSRGILSKLSENGRLIVIDKDPSAIAEAKKLQEEDKRVSFFHGSYAEVKEMCDMENITGKVSGIIADLGVSSPQLDIGDRGFSFTKDGPLDMRMDTSKGITAEQWIAETKEEDIANKIYEYGEERFSRRIAKAIVREREEKPITGTLQLADIVSNAIPKKDKFKHPATRTFQAIRIVVNNELEELTKFLSESFDVIKLHGRLVVISFHSLEDRIVKRFFNKLAKGDELPKDIPIQADKIKPKAIKIGKAIKSSDAEVDVNVRARSAVMRTIEILKEEVV